MPSSTPKVVRPRRQLSPAQELERDARNLRTLAAYEERRRKSVAVQKARKQRVQEGAPHV